METEHAGWFGWIVRRKRAIYATLIPAALLAPLALFWGCFYYQQYADRLCLDAVTGPGAGYDCIARRVAAESALPIYTDIAKMLGGAALGALLFGMLYSYVRRDVLRPAHLRAVVGVSALVGAACIAAVLLMGTVWFFVYHY